MLIAWVLAIITGVALHFLGFSVDDLFLGTLLSFALTLLVHIFFLKREFKH
ncbi:hypothetical protein [Mariprofundus sp. KV]|uniref:hypothetical protein n=1 Tax=Mariprofundus sp. KV TaxID=2608715 RepID=UPI0015A48A9C|nr:hypothetical protein [Mariprofundus sp. KV]